MSWVAAGRRSPTQLDELLARSQRQAPTYDHDGSTLGDPPPGIDDRTFTRDVAGELAAARRTLHRWATHAGIGARIHPVPEAPHPVEEGDTVLVILPVGPAEAIIANRIVAVVDEASRVGLAYGSLPGHPETGEELFLAERTAPGRLHLTVRIHARPATPLVRLAGPLTPRLQALAARRYLAAWATAIIQETR